MAYNIKNCVYLVRCDGHERGVYKIGLTTDLDTRIKSLSSATEAPGPFYPLAVIETDKYRLLESYMHSRYTDERMFPNKEFFKFIDEEGNEYIDDVIDEMQRLAELMNAKITVFDDNIEKDEKKGRAKRFYFKNIGLKGGDEVILDIPKNENTPHTYYVASDGRHIVEDAADINNKEVWLSVSKLMQEYTDTRQWAVHPEWWYHDGVSCASKFQNN